jgi:hypothetical protein
MDRGELGLLEIGVDIGAGQRNKREQTRPGLNIFAKLRRPVADDAVERRDDRGEGEIALGLGERGFELAARALRLDLLCG